MKEYDGRNQVPERLDITKLERVFADLYERAKGIYDPSSSSHANTTIPEPNLPDSSFDRRTDILHEYIHFFYVGILRTRVPKAFIPRKGWFNLSNFPELSAGLS